LFEKVFTKKLENQQKIEYRKRFHKRSFYIFGEVPNKKQDERILSRLPSKRGASLGQIKYQVFPSQSVLQSSSTSSFKRNFEILFPKMCVLLWS